MQDAAALAQADTGRLLEVTGQADGGGARREHCGSSAHAASPLQQEEAAAKAAQRTPCAQTLLPTATVSFARVPAGSAQLVKQTSDVFNDFLYLSPA